MPTKPQKPTREFGTRRPSVPVVAHPGPPAKRSGHVGLLLMGTLAVGGGAYALMPRNNCEPSPPGMAQPGGPQAVTDCQPRGSSSGGRGGSGGGRSYFSSGSSSSQSVSGASDSGSSHVARGGFGSFAHAFGFSGG